MSQNPIAFGGRRRIHRRAFVRGTAVAGAVAGIASLAGCSPPISTAPATSSAAVAPTPPPAAAQPTPAATATAQAKLGGTFRISTQGETPSLDLHQVPTLVLHTGPAIAWSKLLQYRTDVQPGELVPTADLAASWEQPDDVTYLFKLQPGAKFQNIAPVSGRPVTADDVKFSFERQIALKTNAGRLPLIDKIEVVDPQTVKIVSPKPDADFLVSLAYASNRIVPHETVEAKGDLTEGPIIGSGAWIFDQWDRNKVSSSVKNPDYYLKGFPRIDRVEIPRVPDPATVIAAFRAKQLDTVGGSLLNAQDAEALRKTNPEVVLETYNEVTGGITLMLNGTKAPLSDLRVRQAIFKAIDKQAIASTIYNGKAWYFAGVRMPRKDFYLPEADVLALYKQDQAAARQLLTQANATNLPEFEIYALGFGNTYKDAAELVQADLAKVGIKTRIKVSDSNTAWTAAMFVDGTFDIAVGAYTPISPNADLFANYLGSAVRNPTKIKDAALDAKINQQAVMVKDPEGRKKILLDIQRTIIEQGQFMALVGNQPNVVRWPYLKDFFIGSSIEEAYTRLWLDK
jgi:ABC-type transport system substrate-binding protein